MAWNALVIKAQMLCHKIISCLCTAELTVESEAAQTVWGWPCDCHSVCPDSWENTRLLDENPLIFFSWITPVLLPTHHFSFNFSFCLSVNFQNFHIFIMSWKLRITRGKVKKWGKVLLYGHHLVYYIWQQIRNQKLNYQKDEILQKHSTNCKKSKKIFTSDFAKWKYFLFHSG